MSFDDFKIFTSSFDPAIELHSEPPDVLCAPVSYSDDIEALESDRETSKVAKIRNKVVIQHRAWHLPQVFRSDDSCLPGMEQHCSSILLLTT